MSMEHSKYDEKHMEERFIDVFDILQYLIKKNNKNPRLKR